MALRKRTFLHDAIDMISMGSHTLESDDFTRCFQPISGIEMDSSGIFYTFSFLIRYFVLFPARFAFFAACMAIFCLMVMRYTVTGNIKQLDSAFMFINKSLMMATNAKIRHIGEKARLNEPHVYVANHTSFFDFMLLSSYKFPHACVSENHGGLFSFLFKLILTRNGSIAFKRSERVDRRLVVEKLKVHVQNTQWAPMLIFPEGTCVNNKFSVLFQKGAFELGVAICPVAIKFKRGLFDPYWNRRVHGFATHMFYLMTRWRVEAEVRWMQPVRIMKGENPTQFSHRVKILISKSAGLKNTLWNGLLKSSPAIKDREMLGEAYLITYGKMASKGFCKNEQKTDKNKVYLCDENIDNTSTRNHLYFEAAIPYKKFQNEVLKEYLRLKELPQTELKFLLTNHKSVSDSLKDANGGMFCNCQSKL
ncbi:putative acyltransferase [Ordospora pajunii]|uniref:putative acyltransferase n=1 Tax=Ordospora pajunii TaxID=3039483 RepID=UPI0029528D88|nr:putative acyltransferase [Ordospora pajunii]KAH9411514.1 putative acyltransferase [Ordospora pajunii]